MNIRNIISRTSLLVITLLLAVAGVQAQTMNIHQGSVTYAVPAAEAGEMPFTNSMTLTVGQRAYVLDNITSITIDDSEVQNNTVKVAYSGESAQVIIAGNIAPYVEATVKGAHVALVQAADYAGDEITYVLSGQSDNGSLWMDGKLKASFLFNGLTLHNPDSAAINIRDGKRISMELADGTTNTLSDGEGGSWKACLMVKGHTELKGAGTLSIAGNSGHAFWGKEYVEVKKTFGTLNITKAVGDGFNVNQYFEMKGGQIHISGVGDDGIQLSYDTDDDGNIVEEDENTGELTVSAGTLSIHLTNDGGKALKTAGSFIMKGGSVDITQSGNLVVDGADVSYGTSVKADENINISGGSLTINNTAEGGKGLNADGNITIDETVATVTIDIKANGAGGTAETSGSSSSDDDTQKSYKVYVALPTSGGGGGYGGSRAWKNIYLYKADGTLVQQLTNTVTRSSGTGYYAQTYTFYYYDFQNADDGNYYFKSDDYTSGGGWGGGATYTIVSATFSKPTSGEDIYYQISNSYTTSGSTRTYSLSNVTSSFNDSTSDQSEENGTSYNAAGIKADGNITISGGTISVENKGAMSKSIKSKQTVTIDGGELTLKPSGTVKIINNDASYSTAIKTVDFVQNGGSVIITNSGTSNRGVSATNITTNGGALSITDSSGGYQGSSDTYTAKGLKADAKIALNGGDITIKMTGNGGKCIKSSGVYTQGLEDGTGPSLNLSTSGSSFGSSSSSGWGGGGMGGTTGADAKAIKVMGAVTIYGGETQVYTSSDGAEGLESKTSIDIRGGQHYFQCYDDCINSSGKIVFNGGATVCYSNGNDAVDSNYGSSGAITIGNGAVFAYTSAGGPEEGFDCDNNSYIKIEGKGIGISAGSSQGGGWGGSSGSISGAAQGYNLYTSSISYKTGKYYALCDASGNNLVTYNFETNVTSTLALFTATGMTKGSTYYVRPLDSAPSDAETSWHGLYLGCSTKVTTTSQTASFTAN